MYSYEKFYDHFVIKENDNILCHVDTEAEANKTIFELKSENIDFSKEDLKNVGKNYVVYHLHTDDSLLDSCTNYKLYVDRAVELGQKAICFTEHGNMYHHFKKRSYCEEKGIKYLHGIECYVTKTFDENIRDNYHTILIAKNDDGVIELNRLVSQTTQEGHVYYKPRISFEEFLNISDNIIKISACLASPLWKFKKKIESDRCNGLDVSKDMDLYIKVAKHYDYYEIQYHNVDEQIEYNKYLYKLSKRYNIPLIMGTDTHSLNEYKAKCRIILKYGKTDGDWGDSENQLDLTYKTYDEIIELVKEQDCIPFNEYLKAIENTNVMADSVEYSKVDTSIKYPILYEGQDEEKILWDTLRRKYKEKLSKGIIKNIPKYAENIKEEMRVFKKINMIGFMLFMSEMMTWVRENNIFTSYCRGSVGGSTVAYISDIIDVDPIKWNTVFSRFANEDREEVGDIDCDFYEEDRPKVYKYIFDRFGDRKTSYILAVGTLANKSVIDTVCKALNVLAEENGKPKVYTSEDVKAIKKEFSDDPQSAREKYPNIFYYYDGLVGCTVSQSMHPAGVVASPIDLIDNYGVFYNDGMRILNLDMDEVHECGLVKYDILGLKGVGIIEKTCQLAEIPYPYSYDLDWNDQDVYKDMAEDGTFIFQFESDFAHSTLKNYFYKCKDDGKPFTIDDMSLCNACIRPSGESYRDKLLQRIPYKNPSKMIDELFEETNGYLVYQEQTIAFLQQICGLSGSEADNIRRAIGRKQRDRLEKAMPQILNGYCSKSDKPKDKAEIEAKQFLQILEDSASYQFGFNHSTGYSMVGYALGYLRYYYPIEFCTASLNCSESDEDIANGTKLIKAKGFKLEMPRFRKSISVWNCDKNNNTIYKGIGSIKDISKMCGDNLYTLKDNKYDTFISLLDDIKKNKLADKSEKEILILIDFFSEFGDLSKLMYLHNLYMKYGTRKTISKSEIKDDFPFTTDMIIRFSEKETKAQYRGVDMIGLLSYYEQHLNWTTETTLLQHMCNEVALLGYTDKTDNSLEENYAIISNVDTNKYGTTFLSLYSPKYGVIEQYKVDKKWYNQFPCNVGDLLRVNIEEKNKRKKNADGEWYESDETELKITTYYIVEKFNKNKE